jgi:hypothetical protein
MCRGGFCGDRVRNRGVPEKRRDFTACSGGFARLCWGVLTRDTELNIQEEGKEGESWRMRQRLSSEFISRGGEVCERLLLRARYFVSRSSGGTDAMTIRCSDSRK